MRMVLGYGVLAAILAGTIGALVFCADANGQTKADAKNKKRDFGWSLKEFDKKEFDKMEKGDAGRKTDDRVADSDGEVIRVETELILNDLLVVNEKGNPVVGLGVSDFIVAEDGKPQEIDLFAFGENSSLPRSIVLILNLGGAGSSQRVESLRSFGAAQSLVDRLRPEDRMAIATIDVKLATDFTNDKDKLKQTLNSLRKKSPSAIDYPWWSYGTLIAVLNEMFDVRKNVPIVIFQDVGSELGLLSDVDEHLELPEGTPELRSLAESRKLLDARLSGSDSGRRILKEYRNNAAMRRYGFLNVIQSVERSRATIYTVVPNPRLVGFPMLEVERRITRWYGEWMGLSEDSQSRVFRSRISQELRYDDLSSYVRLQAGMIQVAALSGGLANFVESPRDFEKVYDDIFTIIENRYTIGYHSNSDRRDGRARSVKITVRGHPNYRIIGRDTYTPPRQ